VTAVYQGKLPFKHKLRDNELAKIIFKSEITCHIANEDSPRIFFSIEKENGKRKTISLMPTGNLNIMGIKTEKEAQEFYQTILKEIQKLCPRVFNDGN